MQRRPVLISARVRARSPGCLESVEAIAQSVARHFQGGTFSLPRKAIVFAGRSGTLARRVQRKMPVTRDGGRRLVGGRIDGFIGPALPDCGQKLLLAVLHLADERLIFGFFVRGGPKDHFREYGRKIDSLGSEDVNKLSAVRRVLFRGDDSMRLQPPQAIRQYVGRDSFVRLQEFLVAPESPEHHVAQNQQRPAVAQHLDGSIQRTPRPALWTRLLLGHIRMVSDLTCISQVN